MLGVASRAEVARRTGLSRSTVSSIVSELQAEGVVIDREDDGPAGDRRWPAPGADRARSRRGARRGHRLRKAPPRRGGRRPRRTTCSPRSRGRCRRTTRPRRASGSRRPRRSDARRSGEQTATRSSASAWGCPGPIHRTGLVGSSAILPGWAGTHGGERMAERLGLPVRVDNDANLGALAEATWGAGPRRQTSSTSSCRTGIGAGIVIGGRLFGGAGGTAGEIGHTTLDETGAALPLREPRLPRDLRRRTRPSHGSSAAAAAQELDLDGAHRMAAEGDPACRRALRDAGRHIGVAVANLCNLFNPERIVVGGSMGHAGDLLLDPLRESVAATGDPERGRGRGGRPRRARRARRGARRGRARARTRPARPGTGPLRREDEDSRKSTSNLRGGNG